MNASPPRVEPLCVVPRPVRGIERPLTALVGIDVAAIALVGNNDLVVPCVWSV